MEWKYLGVTLNLTWTFRHSTHWIYILVGYQKRKHLIHNVLLKCYVITRFQTAKWRIMCKLRCHCINSSTSYLKTMLGLCFSVLFYEVYFYFYRMYLKISSHWKILKASNRELILSSAKYYFLLILGTGKIKTSLLYISGQKLLA